MNQGWKLDFHGVAPPEFEIRIKNQSIALDPPLEHCRIYYFNVLEELTGMF
jgi:hypothetical protein